MYQLITNIKLTAMPRRVLPQCVNDVTFFGKCVTLLLVTECIFVTKIIHVLKRW